jgi:N-acetylneuraminic acid mutarotase
MASDRGTWTLTGSMNVARAAYAATLLQNGKVLVAGGVTTGGIPLATAELYNPSTGRWLATGSMSVARVLPAMVLLQDGKVLVAGGE